MVILYLQFRSLGTTMMVFSAILMTSATTILALIPILTSTGRGSDIMVPLAINGTTLSG